MTDPIATLLGVSLCVTLYCFFRYAIVEGLRLNREIKATRREIELEQWRIQQRQGSRTTFPSARAQRAAPPYLGLDVPEFVNRSNTHA